MTRVYILCNTSNVSATLTYATIGYGRVSPRDQNPDSQIDALLAAGCDKIFVEHASDTLAKRPALTDALEYLRVGDTLVVNKLDRLGRSVKNLKQVADELQDRGVGLKAFSQGIDTTTPGGRLFFHMLAANAEFEHDLIVERTHDGLAAAHARGQKADPNSRLHPPKSDKPAPCTTKANTPSKKSPTPSAYPAPPSTDTLRRVRRPADPQTKGHPAS